MVRTRFAPSPTGFLHVGSARTALYAYLFARHHGGQFILRIEDTDKEREVEGAIGHMMESLRWLGITWDESIDTDGPHAPYIQSERLPIYERYARMLIDKGLAYPDPYTEEDVAAMRARAEAEKRPFLYREHRPETTEVWDGTKPLRLRVPQIKRYTWHDVVLGELSAGEEALDDFVLIKSDGYPTYNFAHVVDDIEMKITHVMRGQEFVSSTPKFLSLYDALGEVPPVFATLPPILGDGGHKKLSKRDGAKDVLDYRREGYLPDALVNFLALLGWNPGGDQEVFTRSELIVAFSLERVQRSGAQFDEDKLLHLNREWMRTLPDEVYMKELAVELPQDLLRKLVPILKERAHTFAEARTMLDTELAYFTTTPTLDRERLIAKQVGNDSAYTRDMLAHLRELIAMFPINASNEDVKAALMPVAEEAEASQKGGRGATLWPLRYALTGAERSPDPFTVIHILGPQESVRRIDAALAIL